METVIVLIGDELFTLDDEGELVPVGEWWQRGDDQPEFNQESEE